MDARGRLLLCTHNYSNFNLCHSFIERLCPPLWEGPLWEVPLYTHTHTHRIGIFFVTSLLGEIASTIIIAPWAKHNCGGYIDASSSTYPIHYLLSYRRCTSVMLLM